MTATDTPSPAATAGDQLAAPPSSPAAPPGPTLYTEDTLAAVLAVAELPLDEQRRAELLTVATELHPALAAIRSADLGETAPATAFDPRWE